MSLQFDKGRAYVVQAMKDDPYNLMATLISDYEDCLLLLFNGDKEDLRQRKSHMDARLSLLNKADKNTPWYRFSKAGIYMHWALVHLRFGDNFKAAGAFRKSYLLLKDNKRLYPAFEYNDVYLGLAETVVGVIPDDYKWVASIFGMRGNVKKGISKLDAFVKSNNNDDFLQREAAIFNIYLGFYLMHDQQQVWSYVNDNSAFPVNDNLMNQFVYANIAINYRKAARAIEVLRSAQKDKHYARFPVFDYEMGSALLNKTDSSSIPYLRLFVRSSKSSLFIKDTYHKLFQAYVLNGDLANAVACRQKILQEGTQMVDADKQAQRFAQSGEMPDKRLLTARLLIDGGYYENALSILGKYKEVDFSDIVSRLEYNFRMGRIYEELEKYTAALSFYDKTILIGSERKEYYAARALLQSAFIYEKTHRGNEALKTYKECLRLKGHDFQNSIDQMAKAGIDRLQ